jgi:hypothetical protein
MTTATNYETPVLPTQSTNHSVPGWFLPWAVNAGIQAFGLHDGKQISDTQSYLERRPRMARIKVRDVPFINRTDEVIMALPALVQARRECCQILLDNEEWIRAIDARCVQ